MVYLIAGAILLTLVGGPMLGVFVAYRVYPGVGTRDDSGIFVARFTSWVVRVLTIVGTIGLGTALGYWSL